MVGKMAELKEYASVEESDFVMAPLWVELLVIFSAVEKVVYLELS